MAGTGGKRPRVEENELDLEMETSIMTLLSELKVSISQINTKLEDLPCIKTEIQAIYKNITEMKSEINENKTLININTVEVAKIKSNLCNVQHNVCEIQSKLDYLEREKRMLNLIVSNLPLDTKMNDQEIVFKIGNSLKLDLQTKILKLKRLPNKVENGYSPLLISCNNIDTKNEIISAYISLRSNTNCNKNNITLRDLGISELNDPIYISDHLTIRSNQLFSYARRARKLEPNFFLSSITRN